MFFMGHLSAFSPSTPRKLLRPISRGLYILLLSGLLIPSTTLADPPHLPNEYFNTSDAAKAACVAKLPWYQANYGWPNGYSCVWTHEGNFAAKWAVWDDILNGPTLTALFKAIYPIRQCPPTQNYVAPGVCTIPPPNKINACSGDAMKGNPCNAATGNKFQSEVDLTSVDGGIPIIRYYNSQLMVDVGFGVGWTSSILGKRLYINPTTV
jgi:hypothetical protein